MNTRPLKLINRQLQKPWLLISSYEKAFDNFLSMTNRLQRIYAKYGGDPDKYKWHNRHNGIHARELSRQIEASQENLRNIDQMIHNYIKNNNKPQR